MITLALSKGRILDECLPLLKAAGIEVLEDPETSRKLILATSRPDVRVVLVRASDVPTYVQYGGADLGVAGKDILLEHGGEGLYQPLDLKIARCRMSVATRADFDYASAVKQGSRIRVATKYTGVARQHFADKGVHVDLIKLYGSMELAPLTGLADAIVDLVSSGSTLRANNLVEVEQHRRHLVAADRQPGRAEAEARRDPALDRGVREGGARHEHPSRRLLDTAQPDFEAQFAALQWSAETDASIDATRGRDHCRRARNAATRRCWTTRARFDGVNAASVAALDVVARRTGGGAGGDHA